VVVAKYKTILIYWEIRVIRVFVIIILVQFRCKQLACIAV